MPVVGGNVLDLGILRHHCITPVTEDQQEPIAGLCMHPACHFHRIIQPEEQLLSRSIGLAGMIMAQPLVQRPSIHDPHACIIGPCRCRHLSDEDPCLGLRHQASRRDQAGAVQS